MTTFKLILASLLLSTTAHAEIPAEILKMGGQNGQRQTIDAQTTDGTVTVVDAARIDTLYSDVQLLEITVSNLGLEKEIFVYDLAEMYEFERNVKVQIVKERHQFDFRDGAALYLGKTHDGRDRFLISLTSTFRPTATAPVSIYVKMAGRQYEATNVKLR